MLAGLIRGGSEISRSLAVAGLLALAMSLAHAGETGASTESHWGIGSWRIDTEHLFGFVIGTDVGDVGDKEMEAEVTGDLGKRPGSYTAFFRPSNTNSCRLPIFVLPRP